MCGPHESLPNESQASRMHHQSMASHFPASFHPSIMGTAFFFNRSPWIYDNYIQDINVREREGFKVEGRGERKFEQTLRSSITSHLDRLVESDEEEDAVVVHVSMNDMEQCL